MLHYRVYTRNLHFFENNSAVSEIASSDRVSQVRDYVEVLRNDPLQFESEMSSMQSSVTDIWTLSIKNLGRHSLVSPSRGRRSRFTSTHLREDRKVRRRRLRRSILAHKSVWLGALSIAGIMPAREYATGNIPSHNE